MKNMLIVTLALVAILGVSTWAYTTLRQRTFVGESLSFQVGSGTVSVTNPADRPIRVEMHAAGERPFRIKSALLGIQESAARQAAEADLHHAVAFELPPGEITIDVIRGSSVWFTANADTPLQAAVTPLRAHGVQLTIMFTGAVILIALYSISSTMQHRWVELLREKSHAHTLPTTATVRNRPTTTS